MAILAVVAAIAAIVECQFHVLPFDGEHAASPEHRHTASTHAVSDAHCLIAVLPTVAPLVLLSLFMWAMPILLSKHTLRAFPLFMPPENAARL